MRKLQLSVLSGLLLAFSWPEIGVFLCIFFAFLPLFILENIISISNSKRKRLEVFFYSFVSFLIFNVITTYWVCNATLYGGIAAFLINSLLMSIVFLLYHLVKEILAERLAVLFFISCWIGMEYLHLNWKLAWPWLVLGNVFSNNPALVQWYEYTGFLGGSLWVLLINIMFFNLIKFSKKLINLVVIAVYVIVPISISLLIYSQIYRNSEENLNIVIVQPNIDPYTEKFNIGYKSQLDQFIAISKEKLTQSTDLLVGPETALLEPLWENNIDNSYSVNSFRKLQKEYPNLNILIGSSTFYLFDKDEEKSITARKFANDDWYDVYNSALLIPANGDIQIYHKTKLVPGAEHMPYPHILDRLAKLMVNLGGISGSLSSENTRNIFDLDTLKIKPLICYESIFGELTHHQNIDLLCVITNDGWWKETAGYKQHFSYSRLRAIEQRKAIIRSANTGISGVIDIDGSILERTSWDQELALPLNVNCYDGSTFYNNNGDYIGRLASFLSGLLLIITFVKTRTSL